LKKSLRAIFSEHGEIKDIVAMKTVKMKGQAFIVYSDVKSATAALKELNGFPLYDHPIVSSYFFIFEFFETFFLIFICLGNPLRKRKIFCYWKRRWNHRRIKKEKR